MVPQVTKETQQKAADTLAFCGGGGREEGSGAKKPRWEASGSHQVLCGLALVCATMLPSRVKWQNGHKLLSIRGLPQSRRLVSPCCLQLTVKRWRPCLKSLIPASLLSMHSKPPHWAITPAILYTSSSSSSSSGGERKSSRNRGKDEYGNKTKSPLPGWRNNLPSILIRGIREYLPRIPPSPRTWNVHWSQSSNPRAAESVERAIHTCGGVQGLDKLFSGIAQQSPHSINNPHGLSLRREVGERHS